MRIKHMFFITFFIILYVFINTAWKNTSPEKKINDEFRIVFEQQEEFYILNNILTVEEKERVLLNLKENTPEAKQEMFNRILTEKESEIELIGNYKKEEWKKENEDIINMENKIKKIWNSIFTSHIVKILLSLFIIYVAFRFTFRIPK